MDISKKCRKAGMEEEIMPIKPFAPGAGGKHSKHNILCETVHD